MLLIVSWLGGYALSSIRGPINWAGHCVTFVLPGSVVWSDKVLSDRELAWCPAFPDMQDKSVCS